MRGIIPTQGNARLGRSKVFKAGIFCSAEYPIEEGVAAFEKPNRPNTLKVAIDIAGNGKEALVSN
jgi:hypothetical protein